MKNKYTKRRKQFPINRIVLIGNGFDLAHNMKTSYANFITKMYSDLNKALREKVKFENELFSVDSNEDFLPKYCDNIENCSDLENLYEQNYTSENNNKIPDYISIDNVKNRLHIKSPLFFKYSRKVSIKNWGGFENEYYADLIKFIDKDICQLDDGPINFCRFRNINTLNLSLSEFQQNFEAIKKAFEKYLSDITNTTPLSGFSEEIYNAAIEERELSSDYSKQIEKNIEDEMSDIMPTMQGAPLKDVKFFPVVGSVLFLSFNYTDTEKLYLDSEIAKSHAINTQSIHIHGELNNPDNPIVFGYGDELDENYKKLENKANNELLQNAKSIWYLGSDSYRKFQNFIESNYFQVYIFGHSCSNTDRTLLNYIFEHNNCIGIKPYYHKSESDNGTTTNNYIEIITNISRCFNNKLKMRDRVVNLKYCESIESLNPKKLPNRKL